MPYILFCK